MFEAIDKSLDQKHARIKAALPVTPTRGFALWLALLLLYFLLLPSAADTPERGAPAETAEALFLQDTGRALR
jgi:hypothetical protein